MRPQHLEAARALPRDDLLVVVGVHEREAALLHGAERIVLGGVEVIAFQDHLRAMALGVLDLYEGRVARHHDHRVDAEPVGVVRDSLRVVAGRIRDHALRALRAVERGELVERSSLLEGRGELVVLELEVDLGAADLRKRARGEARRFLHLALDDAGGALDVVEGDGHAWLKRKSTAGLRPLMIAASALPDPHASVQPSVPWPVLI